MSGSSSTKKRSGLRSSYVRLESLIVLVALAGIMSLLSPYFLSASNFFNILLASATIGVLAIGATYVISSAGLDLSLGSVLGLSAVVGAFLAERLGLPWPLAVLGCLAAGAAAGWVNGQLVTRARIPAFIVTLGMLGIARGLALVISDGRAIYGLPEGLVYLGQGRPFGVPMPIFIFLGVAHRHSLYSGAYPASGHTRWRSATMRRRRAPPAFRSTSIGANSTPSPG